METAAGTATAEEEARVTCELCERESAHMIRQIAPDNTVHYVCWDCLYRADKRINVSRRWKRSRRA